MPSKICKDGRVWGQTNKAAGDHLGILTGRKTNYERKFTDEELKEYRKAIGKRLARGKEFGEIGKVVGYATRFKKGHKSPCTMLGKHHSEETKRKMREAHKERVFTDEWKERIGIARSCPHLNQRGENHPRWKGGITSLCEQIRNCFEYRQWRNDVFTRDNFTCQDCGDAVGGNLVAHHKVEFSDILERCEIVTFEEAMKCEELWNINNGVTLCENCHKLKHSKQGEV